MSIEYVRVNGQLVKIVWIDGIPIAPYYPKQVA